MDHVQMMSSQSQLSSSPSFSCYYSSETETFAQIAARVIDELRRDTHSLSDDHDTLFDSWEYSHLHCHDDPIRNDDVNADGDDFEFAFVSRDPNTSPVSADDIFYNGQIMPMYPLFDRNLLFAPTLGDDGVVSVSLIPNPSNETGAAARRLPLGKLMLEERETGSCSSSTSEAEDNSELDGVAAGTYCVWNPKASVVAADSMGRSCKKSKSTGSASKRWKLRDLVLRSDSVGKESFMFLGASKRTNKVSHEMAPKASSADNNGAGAVGAAKEGDHQTKRKSLLPHRKELLGLFSNVNGFGRNLHPF